MGSKFNFSEHGHVAYQIKENKVFSEVKANILLTAPPFPRPLGGVIIKVKIHFFQNMVMLFIKLNGTIFAAIW